MRLTFLGTGTSFGVPVLGCGCAVCRSEDPRDRRLRHAALVSWDDGRRLLVDTPPELRLQLLREGATTLDAVWFTHVHADHVHGIDDLRIFSMRTKRSLPAYGAEETCATIARRFDYIFDPAVRPGPGSSKPHLDLRVVRPGEPVTVAGERVVPVEAPHGPDRVMGFRVGALGYVTDAKRLPKEALRHLRGVRVLVLNALWEGDPHPTHFNVEEAVEAAALVGAERTFLTHLTHRVVHAELARTLPPGIAPAYDGLSVPVPDEASRPDDAERGGGASGPDGAAGPPGTTEHPQARGAQSVGRNVGESTP
jgi:phosphoribosyl 1,2-cyclic phosphate phosphodiesterase